MKPYSTVEKHKKALEGTVFAKKCAPCPRTQGRKIEGEKGVEMYCSGVHELVTPIQAGLCNGVKPPVHKKKMGRKRA
jgi:hypothetical protein